MFLGNKTSEQYMILFLFVKNKKKKILQNSKGMLSQGQSWKSFLSHVFPNHDTMLKYEYRTGRFRIKSNVIKWKKKISQEVLRKIC